MPEPILILSGAPGAGKTTTARLLAVGFERAVHLESDAFFRFIRSGYVEPWRPDSHEQNTTVMRIVATAAAAYAAAGYFTIIDGIISPAWFLEPVRDALKSAGQVVAYAVLQAPLSVCTARAVGRGGEGSIDPSVIERLWQDFADLGDLKQNALDCAERSAAQVAELLKERMQQGLLTI